MLVEHFWKMAALMLVNLNLFQKRPLDAHLSRRKKNSLIKDLHVWNEYWKTVSGTSFENSKEMMNL